MDKNFCPFFFLVMKFFQKKKQFIQLKQNALDIIFFIFILTTQLKKYFN
jgi:hypothetical protein